MSTRIRTLNFLPEVFQTPTNAQFLAASLDQLVDQPKVKKIEGYIGSKFGYGINAKDYYVVEPTKTRTDYQLEPGVVFTKPNESVAQDFISYPGLIDALKLEGGLTNNNDRLFNSQFYSWDSFSNLDKIINFNQYYWIPNGPEQVVVSTDTVFSINDYIVTDVVNGYNISPVNSPGGGATNPTITLLRGGTYTFAVNQESQFWIQGAPGVTGYDPNQPNMQTRDVLGVSNNGTTSGLVIFNVPSKDAQNQYNFPGNNQVDIVSSLSFEEVEGARVSDLAGGIDGVTALEGLTVMFYQPGNPYEAGYVSKFFDSTNYDANGNLIAPITVNVTATNGIGDIITCDDTSSMAVDNAITFTGTSFGNLSTSTIYYISSIISPTMFTVSTEIGGATFTVTTDSGSLVGNVNQGLYEEGYYANINDTFFTISYVGDISDPIISLTPSTAIPTNQKITARFGTQWIDRIFYKNIAGAIALVPFLSAPLDTLYYQDGTSANKVGVIKIIDSNITNTLDIETEILGKKTYTSPNGVKFTNGLKVVFQGDIQPISYLNGEYYVEGVGNAIELISAQDLVAPEPFTESTYIPWDTTSWDMSNWEGDSYIPVTPDYITIARNSIDKNPWSRSNRWFHIDVINATATYNNNPDLVTLYSSVDAKAKRPIIEFYPNLRLFNAGTEGKNPVDFVDFRTTDAFSLVAGQENYYPDVTAYSTYTATVTGTDYSANRAASASSSVNNAFTVDSTAGFNKNDIVTFFGAPWFGGITPNDVYYVKEVLSATEFTIATIQDGDTFELTTGSGYMDVTWTPQSTTITVDASAITGSIKVGQYIADSSSVLPRNCTVTSITGLSTLTIGISWTEASGSYFPSTSDLSILFTDTTIDNYALFDGSTVIFAADTNLAVRNKIYVSRFSTVDPLSPPVITLTEIEGGQVLQDQQTVITRGYNYQGKNFYFDGVDWIPGQSKITVNQAPLFDVFDANGVSFGNSDVYVGTSFAGNKLFAYGIGAGLDDSILGFPLRYSSVDNVGDISFDVSLNADTFDYVTGSDPVTQPVNTGYVYQYNTRVDYIRQLGWQTAVSPSIQYQLFQFDFDVKTQNTTFKCDIAMADSTVTNWPTIQVYINNQIQSKDSYVVTTTADTTTVVLNTAPLVNTVIQISIYSDQVSKTAFYTIPINLNNNPLNQDITVANVGDIRGQYQSIFYNNPNTTGDVFGANNYHDLGNLVPWGSKIIQNSASLVLPGAFLRKQNHNLFNSLMFNSREYIKFKTLLVDTVNNTEYSQRYDASALLDDALDQITATKTENQPFFWSDMLPSKAAYISNTYSFANSLDLSIYPLSRVYDFSTANYYGVLVYLTRTVNNITKVTQLIKGQDYDVSSTSPSLTVTLDLLPGDIITIKEYNQTYGSYVPNTPTKLGLYPATAPQVILDSDYTTPTYFIKGHDGSYNKLYGDYDPSTGILVDFRDQVLLEYETRVYNNLKISATIPIKEYEVLPGFFRDTTYSYNEWLLMYSSSFLNWVGQNRLDYKKQNYNSNDQYTYNYWQSGNKINKDSIEIGYWRGIYQYFYDTTTPNLTPWEMLGFKSQPSWWTERYGPAPYTSDNLILWNDLAQGIDWNNGEPVVIQQAVRPELLQIIPVNSNGDLLSPFEAIVGNYDGKIFQREWKVGDSAPVEFSYRRSSSYPFDLMRLLALTRPADFFNLAVDVDNYKYNVEFNQYLVNNRSHLKISDIEVYGSGTAKTSYINWIVDYEKQAGVDATNIITTMLDNLDVRLVYRLAGFSDKSMLKFYVEKGTPNSKNASLLIPDESYSVLLYDNQPFNKIVYSGVVVQMVNGGFSVYGNSQTQAYFKTLKPKYDGNNTNITVEKISVKVTDHYDDVEVIVPYSTVFYSVHEVSQFLASYGAYLQSQGMTFNQLEQELEVNWKQMIAEFLYWAQTGWEVGSITTLNPAAKILAINKDSNIVQPLTIQNTNFILNQNLYPIQSKDLSVVREGTAFTAQALNEGDTIAYGQFNISNFEHGIVFDNVTLFNDTIYNLITGLRQTRILTRGSKSAEWNGTVDAQGFIYNQDNISEWDGKIKYTKGEIVKYKNKYWTSVKVVQPSLNFNEQEWVRTDYDEIQKGLLPNPSTRSYESTLYYDINKANLENDADLLSFSLIGYRPRDYLALVDLTDITQINVYRNLIKNKGTKNAVSAFKGANFPQGGIDYDLYENWSIKSAEFGGVLNSNFLEFRLNENLLTGNPSIVGLTNGVYNEGVQQEVPLYTLFNYERPITDVNVLPELPTTTPSTLFPTAGYVNFNDVKMSSYFYSQMAAATAENGNIVPISEFYVRDYVWLANYLETWQVFTPVSLGQIVSVSNNLNGTATVTFAEPHNLTQYQPFGIVNFNTLVDGYYVANIVIDTYKVMITLSLDPSMPQLTGYGIGLRFQSQRVATPADIINLPLTESEFIKNTVWVDTNTDGGWAVYRKSINYQYQEEKLGTGEANSTYGNAVATGDILGYLVADAGLGEVYRYTYNALFKEFQLFQVLTGGQTFGDVIAYSGNTYVITEPDLDAVHIYNLSNTILDQNLNLVQTILGDELFSSPKAIALSGDENWLYIGTQTGTNVFVYRKSQLTGLYEYSNQITVSGLGSFDGFGHALSTNYEGDTLIVGAPNKDYSISIENWGYSYIFNRLTQNIEVDYTSLPQSAQVFDLAWTPATLVTTSTSTTSGTNIISCLDTTDFVVDAPVIFTGDPLLGSNILPNRVYYIYAVIDGTDFQIKDTRDSLVPVTLGNSSGLGMIINVQVTPLYVSLNGTLVEDNNYAVVGSSLYYTTQLNAGDILTIGSQEFALVQTLTSNNTPRIGVQFGFSVDTSTQGSEILVGAPFELTTGNVEGAVYRYTNGGAKYGVVTGTQTVNVTTARYLLINGYLVTIPAGDATVAAQAIAFSNISNVTATAVDGKLVISLLNNSIAPVNRKLVLSATTEDTLTELGLTLYSNTQTIFAPHTEGSTQFGTVVKFNEFGSFVASAPVGSRYSATTFDFSDDENQDDDTIFDNNATSWIDTYPNAGAVYMFDYVQQYNENINNVGKFIYAQSINAQNQEYGYQPKYGTAIDFNNYDVIVGTPNFMPGLYNGQVVTYTNSLEMADWSVFRSSSPVVDINRISSIQIFSALTNNTLINLDYIDPLNGKILGAVRENIDIISNNDPAVYNPGNVIPNGLIWGASRIGQIWFDTTNVRFVNYHQNDIVYNSKYWASVFPGSDVAVYTWVASNVPPASYTGPGTPYSTTNFTVQYVINASGELSPTYYFWAKNTNTVYSIEGKTLADSVIASYIQTPKNSGISYFAPLLPNVFGLYNSTEYINATDSVINIGFATGTNDDTAHIQYDLIRDGYPSDFLPGLPGSGNTAGGVSSGQPTSLYDRLLDSLCGVDETGNVVPNPFLPKIVQSGVSARPRQSFFLNRFLALKNYLTFANEILAQYPITEIRQSISFLTSSGEFYDTADYWEYINWWSPGYNDNTKSSLQVSKYADLATLNVPSGTIVTVTANLGGSFEVYVLQSTGIWKRIGLENGTIRFKSSLWDYESVRLGFGDNFFDTIPYDQYPSEETRKIVRALNEQIYTDDLLIYRNKGLILLFAYIQSETVESQNYLPWLNKTSLVDVAHTIRELRPIEVFQTDNQEFLSGYLNEVKPYHVVIKEFLFKYTGIDVFEGDITDFDLPAKYNSTVEQFITPQLVYQNPNGVDQFLPSDSIWEEPEYTQWYQNHGVSITGENNVEMTVLASYLATNTLNLAVDNAQGFPINGVITVGTEQIGYSSVDRANNILSGLTRGVNDTLIQNHLPGEKVYMDLPAVIVLESGRGYAEPPKALAVIDTTIYPEPTRPAQLQVVMNLDAVLRVDVIDPGQGYAVLPEIVIDPAFTVTFSSADVNIMASTIQLYSPSLRTGDLVQYFNNAGSTTVGGLQSGNWYYVNVLENDPLSILGLYSSYFDAVNNRDRLTLFTTGTGTHSLNIGARATTITSATPIRENNITLRFDRTTYDSQVIDWRSGSYYGAFFAGNYSNRRGAASSSIQLESTQPPVQSILASNEGVTLQVSGVTNRHDVTYSSFVRHISNTFSSGNKIRLISQDDGSNNPNASGTTIGFYVGMPIKFYGPVIGGLVEDTVYYVHTIYNSLDFAVSATPSGGQVVLSNAAVGSVPVDVYVGEVTDTAVITVIYPGIAKVTNTYSGVNTLTIPLEPTGTGGTKNFFTNLAVFFTGTMIGGLVENQVYYVISVLDKQTFTISETENPTIYQVTDTIASSDTVVLTETTVGLALNEPVVFSDMLVGGNPVTSFGGIQSDTIYYIASIVDNNEITLSTTVNGLPISLTNQSGSMSMTSQKSVVQLTTDSGSNMTINVGLPVSPGQINGQKFNFYQTSSQYPGLTGTMGNMLTKNISALLSGPKIIALNNSASLQGVYVNLPLRVSANIGNLTSGTTYYVVNYDVVEVIASATSSSGNLITCDDTSLMYIDMPIVFSGVGMGGVNINVEYLVHSIVSSTQFTIKTSAGGSAVTLTTSSGTMIGTGTSYIQLSNTIGGLELDPGSSQQTSTISIGSPALITVTTPIANLTKVKFYTTGSLPTGLSEGLTYYVRNSVGVTFNLSYTPTGALINTSGIQSGTQTVVLAESVIMEQYSTDLPEFDISSSLGGFNAIISYSGSGLAEENTFTILGTDVGGTSPANDVIVTVTSVDSNGSATTVSTSGVGIGEVNSYYVKVISANQLELYSNPLLTVPVSGIGLVYDPIYTTAGTATTSGTNLITVDSTTNFELNDPVVFTGDVVGGIELGVVYYIYTITPTTVTVSTLPANGATVVSLTTETSTGFTMAKQGSLITLPTPFTFNQSIVRYNNRVYLCLISNNDPEFVFGKWELLTSGDRRLNALDRIVGYYQPTVNMPGLDLNQLVEGITYPNSTYKGNAFAPAQQFPLDTILNDQPFYPNEVTVNSVLWDGAKYLGAAEVGSIYSAVINSEDAAEWTIEKIANIDVFPTDIIYANDVYILTTKNAATPIFTSNDGILWAANGRYSPYDSTPYDSTPYDVTSLSVESTLLNSVAERNSVFIAVGENIVRSIDSYTWTEVFGFTNGLINELFGVSSITATGFNGLIAVGKGQAVEVLESVNTTVNINLVLTSSAGVSWTQQARVSRKGFNSVATDGTNIVAVGEDGVIYNSLNGVDWTGINETTILSINDPLNIVNVTSTTGFAVNDPVRFTETFNVFDKNTTYYISSILTSTQVQLSATIGGPVITLSVANPTVPTWMYLYPRTATLNDLLFANSMFMAVGNLGEIITSTDGITWVTQTSGVAENLKGVAYNGDDNIWIAVGENNTIIISNDDGVTWTSSSIFVVDPTTYTVQGDDFQSGYGPEELVPGLVTDSLMLTVATRPGVNWPVTRYGHNGYNVYSMEYTPSSALQTQYSFDRLVQSPSQITVSVINGVTGLSTTIYQPAYSVNWITNVVTLASPLTYLPVADKLRIDVYETGGGDQLVKADTKTDPIHLNSTTGFNEIYVNANYCETLYNGSGVVRPGTIPVETFASSTVAVSDSIFVEDASNFVLNDPVTFYGDVLGGLVEDTIYYVKTVSTFTNSITVSDSLNMLTGVAGPTFSLTDDTGLMNVVISTGPGTPWADPIVYHNGTKLLHGNTGTVTRTKSSTNTVTVNTTASLAPGMRIVFSDTMFGGVIIPQTSYNILSIVDINELTLEDPGNPGNPLVLTNATGGATYVSNDYSFAIAPNGTSAKIIFATGNYDNSTDFISYTLFGETLPVQYGYSLPETELFTGDGVTDTFALANYVSGTNPENAIVEVNGVRQTSSTYTISSITNDIVFNPLNIPALNDDIAVTTFNLTDNQYFNTQYGLTGNIVSKIVNIDNNITVPLATKVVTNTTSGTNYLTVSSTTGFIPGQTAIFYGTGFGGVSADSTTVYFIGTVASATEFTIVDENNNTITLSTATGSMLVYVGGTPTVRITTDAPHGLTTNEVVRLDGIQGSIQLNNNTYYARVITQDVFDIYIEAFNPLLTAVNYPVTSVSTYTGSGYAWLANTYVLVDTVATATTNDPILGNIITVGSTANLISGTPVVFTGSTIGGILPNVVYYVSAISSPTQFTISETWAGPEFVLSTAAGSMNVCQWTQDNVDRLWVTVNGLRVPSSSLRINTGNYVSILTEIGTSDEVIITSMIPSATPNEEVYILSVNQINEPKVYRANTQTRTWLTQPLEITDATIYVNDVHRITDTIVQTAVTPSMVDDKFYIGLEGERGSISSVSVYNVTKAITINPAYCSTTVIDLAPTLVIIGGVWIDPTDVLEITQLIGNTIFVNGEQIGFATVDVGTNSVTGLVRGANGSMVNRYLPKNTEVYSLLPANRLNPEDYNLTWNSNVYNTTDGDPLQISDTNSARFLRGDVN